MYRRLSGPQGRSGRVRKIFPPHRDSIPGPSSPQRVAITTELPGPFMIKKCKVKFTLEQDTNPRGEGEVQLYSFFNLGARWCGWSKPRLGRFTSGKNPVHIVQEAWWTSGPVWTVAENLAPHRNSIPLPSSPQRVALATELSRPISQSTKQYQII